MKTIKLIQSHKSFLHTNIQLYIDQAPSIDSLASGFPHLSDDTNHPETMTEQVWGGALEYVYIIWFPGESYNSAGSEAVESVPNYRTWEEYLAVTPTEQNYCFTSIM